MKRKFVVISVFAGEALAKTKSRPKHLSGEGAVKGNRVDFEEIDIKGGTKAPMMSAVGAGKADKNYDFVKIRQRWHPEMVASTATLD
jgi:hypothetical protein